MEPQAMLIRSAPPTGSEERAAALRALVPALAADAARAIEEEVPAYRRPGPPGGQGALEQLTLRFVGRFVERLIDPATAMKDLVDLCHRIGAAEAYAGRRIDSWNTAVRAAARAALHRIDRESGPPGGDIAALAGVATAQAFVDFVDVLTNAVSEGHARMPMRDGPPDPAETLIRLLVADPPPDTHRLRDAMHDAKWKEPATAAAIALAPRALRRLLPPGFLGDFATSRPFLVVPDPDGPGRRQALKSLLAGQTAVLGPTVHLRQLAHSLRWAREALHLARKGAIRRPPNEELVIAADHAAVILMSRDPLIPGMIEQRLAPLLGYSDGMRHRLAETFLALIECGFNCQRASTHITVHPQTIRHRLRTLEGLFGNDLHDPALRLEFLLFLKAWSAFNAGTAV